MDSVQVEFEISFLHLGKAAKQAIGKEKEVNEFLKKNGEKQIKVLCWVFGYQKKEYSNLVYWGKGGEYDSEYANKIMQGLIGVAYTELLQKVGKNPFQLKKVLNDGVKVKIEYKEAVEKDGK